MCCSRGISKIILVTFNIIFFILGAVMLGLGIFVMVDKSMLMNYVTKIPSVGNTIADIEEQSSVLQSGAIILAVSGGFLFIVGFCGCCGAIKQSSCLLYIYSIIVIILFVIEVAAAGLCIVFKNQAEERLFGVLETTFAERYEGVDYKNGEVRLSTNQYSNALDFAMAYFECCGINGPGDFADTNAWMGKTYDIGGANITAEVSIMCCKMVDKSKFPADIAGIKFTGAEQCVKNINGVYTNMNGCYPKIKDLIINYAYIVIGIGMGVAIIQIFGILAACCLISAIKKDESKKKRYQDHHY